VQHSIVRCTIIGTFMIANGNVMSVLVSRSKTLKSLSIQPVDNRTLAGSLKRLPLATRRWIRGNGFEAIPGTHLLLPDAKGGIAQVLAGVDPDDPIWSLGALPRLLPAGDYRIESAKVLSQTKLTELGFALGAYRFSRYRTKDPDPIRLQVEPESLEQLVPLWRAVSRVRDLVNLPTEDLGPAELGAQVRQLAKTYAGRFQQWVGEKLLQGGFPAIHAVGRASHRSPRLLKLSWGQAGDPLLVLIGKGVCFDTGGLNLKPSGSMRWMKKDMGGAAHALALAELVMQARLPVRLLLLIPAVENGVAGNAYRPGEVITTRAGHTVEVDNTDAEGRLVLGDALAYAVERKPDLVLDFATLTGAARVALGPDLPVLFSNRDTLADALLAMAGSEHDPLWRLPLWQPYRSMLDSYLADMANSGVSRHAGAITAALFLQAFVPDSVPWMHMDVYAWNDSDRPGRPRGGEAQGLRACFAFLQQNYGPA